MDFDYDDDAVNNADKNADRLVDGGPYVGHFTNVTGVTTEEGSEGLLFEFTSPGIGNGQFNLWTKSKAGADTFGLDQLNAIRFLFGMKTRLVSVKGPVKQWQDTPKGRALVDAEGDTFPDLCNKDIGLFLQKEFYTNNSGKKAERFNLFGTFDAATKLFASEIKERKTTPVKYDRLLKSMKDKDSRKPSAAEPEQPAMGGNLGDF